MSLKKLKFSICIPTYNGEKVIGQTIGSILSQDFSDFEIVVVDDCSKDKTEKIIKALGDKRIKLFLNKTNLGYSGNLEASRQKATGEIIFLMGQDDILASGTLAKYNRIFAENSQVGAITRPYYWFDKKITRPVRAKNQLNTKADELVRIVDPIEKVITLFSTLDQLSGLAFRRSMMDRPFHQDIFPCHVYPFASIFKNHPVVFVRDYNIAVRMSSSQTRHVSKIYEKSPLQTWVNLFENVYPEKKFGKFKSQMIKKFVAVNYVGLVQIRNYARYRFLLREIWLLLKYRPENFFAPLFWFFSLGCLLVPTTVLIPLVDWYKNNIYSRKLRKIIFQYKI